MYRYCLTSTKNSSHKYGPCEICHKHASEVFVQVEERQYSTDSETYLEDLLEDAVMYHRNGELGWTHNECFTYYGHEDCLINKRRNNVE